MTLNKNIIRVAPDSWYETVIRAFGKSSVGITFQVTENCCMSCSYCYQHNKSANKMDLEVAKTTIDKLLENYFCITEDYSTLILEFIGGEPFMEVELIEKICDYTLNKLIMLQHPWLPGFRISICSNGILYFTDNVQHFLQKYKNFLSLTITIDGNKELHDLCRIDNQGKGTYDRAISAVRHYREHYGDITETKLTVSPDNVSFLSSAIINLINENFTDIFANCIFEKGWTNYHATILYNELKIIADYFIENKLYDKIFFRFFSENLYMPMDEKDNSNWCGGILKENHMYFAVDHEGNLYPCIRYMKSSLNDTQAPLIIGDIYENNFEKYEKNINLLSNITRRSQSTDECFYCPIAAGCSWCSGYNYEEFGTPNKRATYICCMHKASSLANVYYLNTLYSHLNLNQRFPLFLSENEALNIISKEEYNYLIQLSQLGGDINE